MSTKGDLSSLPCCGDRSALYLLDLSSWARGMYEGARAKGVDVDDPESNLVALGVVKRFVEVLVDREPAFLGVAMDVVGGEPSWRSKLWPGYKRGRTPPGAGYGRQIDILAEVFAAHRIPVFQAQGFEADDFIAALTKRARAASLRVVIMSKDHDLWQLFESGAPSAVVGWDVAGGEVYTHATVEARYGVPPELLAELMALAGDGDEAPGIKGIGVKKGARILKEHKSLETALHRWQWHMGKLGHWLRDGGAEARMSLRLVQLSGDAPILCSLAQLATGWSAADAIAIHRLGVKHGLPILRDAFAVAKVEVSEEREQRWALTRAEALRKAV